MEKELGLGVMEIGVDMIDPAGVKGRGPPYDPMHCVPLAEQQLGKVRPVLSCNSCYQRSPHDMSPV